MSKKHLNNKITFYVISLTEGNKTFYYKRNRIKKHIWQKNTRTRKKVKKLWTLSEPSDYFQNCWTRDIEGAKLFTSELKCMECCKAIVNGDKASEDKGIKSIIDYSNCNIIKLDCKVSIHPDFRCI